MNPRAFIRMALAGLLRLALGDLSQKVLGNRAKARAYYRRFLEAAPGDPQAARIRALVDML